MATLIDAVIDMPDTGECKLDLDKALRLFDQNCMIIKNTSQLCKNEDTYRLARLKPQKSGGRFKSLKINISSHDAIFIIKNLNLTEVKSAVFKNSYTYYHPDYS